ncbi:MAG: hypothetical protein ABIJ16_05240 [Bacteroidota bacterium]
MKTTKNIYGLITGMILLILSGNLYCQQKETIAIISLESRGILTDTITVLNMTRLSIEKTGLYEVLDQYDVADALKKSNINPWACFGKSCLLDAGKVLGADKMISGSIERFGEKIVIILRIVDIKTEAVIKSNVMEFLNQQPELQAMIEISVNNLFGIENDKEIVNMLVNYARPVTSPKTSIRLNGTRMGATWITGPAGKRLETPLAEGGYNMYPVTSMFGYQHELQYLSAGEFQGLFEFLGTVNGLESGTLIPAFTFMNGCRFNNGGFEIGFGPSVRLIKTAKGYFDGNNTWHLESEMPEDVTYQIEEQIDRRGDFRLSTSLMVAVGRTFKSGYLNIPVNIYFSPRKEGSITGISVGFNLARKPKL